MNISPGMKKAIVGFVVVFLIWKFWTAPESLAGDFQTVGAGFGEAWDRLGRFMGALTG